MLVCINFVRHSHANRVFPSFLTTLLDVLQCLLILEFDVLSGIDMWYLFHSDLYLEVIAHV